MSLTALLLIAAGALPSAILDPKMSEKSDAKGDVAGSGSASLEQLYRERIGFNQLGEPVVMVGLASEQESVELWADARAVVGAGDAELHVPKHTRMRFSAELEAPGELVPIAYVESFGDGDGARIAEAVARWKERGFVAHTADAGMVFGLGGKVFDNRKTQVFVDLDTERAGHSAGRQQELRDQLREAYGVTPLFSTRLARPPKGPLVVRAEGLTASAARGWFSVRARHGGVWLKLRGTEKLYRSEVVVAMSPSGRMVVAARLSLEELLKGILPMEIPASSPLEALKAQAVTARGEVLAKLAVRHLNEPFTLCNDVHCQVYGGDGARSAATDRAVELTRGEVLMHGRRLVDAVYSANCGGASEDNDVVWPGPKDAALRGRLDDPSGARPELGDDAALGAFLGEPSDAFCQRASGRLSSPFRWQMTLPAAEVSRLVRGLKDVGEVRALVVTKRGELGRVRTLKVQGTKGDLLVERELPIRRLLGLKSGLFVVSLSAADANGERSFVFRGGGYGHGVGMCQVGAIGRAEAGQSYREILSHYYRGTEVQTLYGHEQSDGLSWSPDP